MERLWSSPLMTFGLAALTALLIHRVIVRPDQKSVTSSSSSAGSSYQRKPLNELPRLSKDNDSYAYERRRTSVAGESFNPDEEPKASRVVHPKSPEARKRIHAIIGKNLLFRNLDLPQKQDIIDAMLEANIKAGENVITQGEEGDFFYIVDSGHFEIFVNEKRVAEAKTGGSFGELALLYGQPRAATVRATEDSVVWKLDRLSFRRIVLSSTFKKRKRIEGVLQEVSIFQSLTPPELVKLADALQSVEFDAGETILAQGDMGDTFFILEDGEVQVHKVVDGQRVDLSKLSKGAYFGEVALLTDGQRAATVTAIGPVTCLAMDKAAFDRLLGPCVDILKRNMATYSQMQAQHGF